MRQLSLLVFICMFTIAGFSQQYNIDSSLASLKMKKDSTLHAFKVQRDSTYYALMHGDSTKIDKEFKDKTKWENLKTISTYPAINGGESSGVITVNDPTEIPDPKIDYKLLFELTSNNPDSIAKEINFGLTEVARKINLHVASGIPLKKIFPVLVIHAGALYAFTKNAVYKEKYKTDNPNLKLISELEALGTRFIGCGQAMVFLDIKRDALLPVMKVSVTAQTALSNYQLKGYVLYQLW